MPFRKDFVWGTAASAYQIEGSVNADGRGRCIWDSYSEEPGRILDGNTVGDACDHYHRFKEDIKLMADMGIQVYRLSVSWPRILPNGTGEVNEKGIAYYSELIGELLKAGITPAITLFHWEYPQALFDQGGWLNPESPLWFENFARIVGERFGDRVKWFFTLNEPQCFIGMAYEELSHAPGIKMPRRDVMRMGHNALLAHGRAVRALRETVPGCKVGMALTGDHYYPATDKAEDIEAARKATFFVPEDQWYFSIAWWADPIYRGCYPTDIDEALRADVPAFTKEDMETIHAPLDFIGQNIYHAAPVKSDGKGGFTLDKRPLGYRKTAIGWPVTPEGMYWLPKFMYERYQMPVYICENGLSCTDGISADGKVHDQPRIDFMQAYLAQLKKAAEEGVDIRGYLHWTMLDNFEWAMGYNDRFGLVYVDYQTQKRIPKDSAAWYAETIRTNGENL